MLVKHKFLELYPLQGKKILIIGTFNPDVPCNKAEFFYGRAKNYFWELLPSMFAKESLKGDVQKQKEFLELHDIELSDLILLVALNEADICNYGDDKLKDVKEYNTDNILEILKKSNTKEVYFTRKSFDKSVENIKKEIVKIKDFCDKNSIKFRFLPTPARFAANEKKRQEWRECFR
ncbi:MAG: hypothetical protein QG565_569 [Campylobacterota bacterium]|nr:hypothetical protein [Campylobacterota bacterium]MDQ1267772.1 hypothetical protein [Campylobacterota bacterium]